MKKRFTLIEIIVSIVVMGILLAIIMINLKDLKKESITASVNQNVSILQTVMDEHYLRHETYPIKDISSLSLERPQLINVEHLKKNGLLKNNLDEGNIPETFYWLDVFGKVWGSTEKGPLAINQLNLNEKDKKMEILLSSKVSQYNIYEAKGYSTAFYSKELMLEANNSKENKSYKVIEEVLVEVEEERYVDFVNPSQESIYLVSTVDEYGLETAPMGKNKDAKKFTTLQGDGVHYFEIENEKVMYWLNFIPVEEKPGNSTITYQFRVKDENGVYQEWTDDFYSLENSTGIEVKVDMKSDSDGNKPSLYDLRVVFKYLDEIENPPLMPKDQIEPDQDNTCPPRHIESTISMYGYGGTNNSGVLVKSFRSSEIDTLDSLKPPDIGLYAKYKLLSTDFYVHDGSNYVKLTDPEKMLNNDCMLVAYNVFVYDKVMPEEKEKTPLCGAGGTTSTYSGNSINRVFFLNLEESQYLKSFNFNQSFEGWIIKALYIEYSHEGKDYVVAKNVREIPDNSCVNIVYKLDKIMGYSPEPPSPPSYELCKGDECVPPTCSTECTPVNIDHCVTVSCDSSEKDWCSLNPNAASCNTTQHCEVGYDECYIPPCTTDCSEGPPSIEDISNEEWTTVETMQFFAHGSVGQVTYWYGFEEFDSRTKQDETKDLVDTRIVYKFAAGNGTSWSNKLQEFTPINSTSIMAVAYIQVRTDKLKEIPVEKYQEVEKIKFSSTEGFLELSAIQPTLAIVAKKNNNEGRNQYSDASQLEWSIEAVDPKNRKIINYEWDFVGKSDVQPTPFNNYAVGEYEIKARAENSIHVWSEWVTFKLKIYQEQPIAVIGLENNLMLGLDTQTQVKFTYRESTDPDGDKIVAVEWDNKGNNYPIGKHTIRVRVKDSEGYWSEWAEKEIEVHEKATRIYRLEAEDILVKEGTPHSNSKASGGAYRMMSDGTDHMVFSFTGTGFDLSKVKATVQYPSTMSVDGVKYPVNNNNQLTIVRGLSYGEHTVVVNKESLGTELYDYIDVYSTNDKITISNFTSKTILNGKDSPNEVNIFSTVLNQSLRIFYVQDKDGMVVTEVVDKDGKVIKQLANQKQDGGSLRNKNIVWDGTDSSGKVVENGIYTIRVSSVGVEGTKSQYGYSVKLNNEIALYRMEAEDVQVISNPSTITKSDTASGGAVRTISSGSATINITFEGTGIDIMKPKTSVASSRTASMKVDGVSYPLVEGLNTVRELPEGTHKLVITKEALGAESIDFFDIYGSNDKIAITGVNSKFSVNGVDYPIHTNVFTPRLGENVKVFYTQDKDGVMTIEVLDSKGKVVKTISNDYQKGGSLRSKFALWDGTDNSNNLLPDGDYTMRLTAIGVFKAKTVYDYKVILENIEPTVRIEAEDASVKGGSVANLASASGGKIRTFSSGGATIKLTFKGTRVDLLKLANTPQYLATMKVDGVEYQLINGFNSIRGLSEGTHELVIQKEALGIERFDYFDIYR